MAGDGEQDQAQDDDHRVPVSQDPCAVGIEDGGKGHDAFRPVTATG